MANNYLKHHKAAETKSSDKLKVDHKAAFRGGHKISMVQIRPPDDFWLEHLESHRKLIVKKMLIFGNI